MLHDHQYPRIFLHMEGMRIPGIFLILLLRFLCHCICMNTLPNLKQKENRKGVQHHWTTQMVRLILLQCFLNNLRYLENVKLKKKKKLEEKQHPGKPDSQEQPSEPLCHYIFCKENQGAAMWFLQQLVIYSIIWVRAVKDTSINLVCIRKNIQNRTSPPFSSKWLKVGP